MTSALRQRTLELLRTHAARYPAWCVIDAYKLLFQACMGPGHAVGDIVETRKRLLSEWEGVEPVLGESLTEDVSLHAPLWRLHLRAAKAQGLGPEAILADFLSCVRAFTQRQDLLGEVWTLLCREVRTGRLLVRDAAELDAVDQRLRQGSFPAANHSAMFRKAYSPAYRLVGRLPVPLKCEVSALVEDRSYMKS